MQQAVDAVTFDVSQLPIGWSKLEALRNIEFMSVTWCVQCVRTVMCVCGATAVRAVRNDACMRGEMGIGTSNNAPNHTGRCSGGCCGYRHDRVCVSCVACRCGSRCGGGRCEFGSIDKHIAVSIDELLLSQRSTASDKRVGVERSRVREEERR